MDLLVGQSPDLGWKVDEDVIWVTTRADARGPLQLRTYDVRDLLMARTNFPAPRIQGLPTGGERYGGAQDEETTHAIDPDIDEGAAGDVIAFDGIGAVIGHEMGHHYLGHLPCSAGNVTASEAIELARTAAGVARVAAVDVRRTHVARAGVGRGWAFGFASRRR